MDYFIADLARMYILDRSVVLGDDVTFTGFAQTSSRDINLGGAQYKFVVGVINFESGGRSEETTLKLVKCIELVGQSSDVEGGYELFAREMTFFQTVLPAFDSVRQIRQLVPTFRASCATMTASSDVGTILFETPKGILNFDCPSFVYPARLSSMVRVIAEFHACSFLTRQLNQDFFANPKLSTPTRTKYTHALPKLRRFLTYFDGIPHYQLQMSRFRNMLDNFGDHLNLPFSPAARNHCWVVCHQNYSKCNLVFQHRSTELPTIFNWQSMGMASLGVDLVILLFIESNSTCKSGLLEFVKEYHNILRQICNDLSPSVEDIVNEIKKCVPFALYTLADRIVKAESEAHVDSPMFPATVWRDYLIMDLYKFLMIGEFI